METSKPPTLGPIFISFMYDLSAKEVITNTQFRNNYFVLNFLYLDYNFWTCTMHSWKDVELAGLLIRLTTIVQQRKYRYKTYAQAREIPVDKIGS